MTIQEASEKWGISKSDVEILCSTNKIEGVLRIEGMSLYRISDVVLIVCKIFKILYKTNE